MALTPEDVVNKRFQPTKFREGYDQDEVDDFLDEVVVEMRRLVQENEELKQRLAGSDSRISELQRSGGQATAGSEEAAPEAAASEPEASEADAVAAPVVVPAPVPAAEPSAGDEAEEAESTNSLLQLARRLHEEHVREGMEKRDALIAEGNATAAKVISEAETKQRNTLEALEGERTKLNQEIDGLRNFEREYRQKLRGYIEGQLHDLDNASVGGPESSTGTGSTRADRGAGAKSATGERAVSGPPAASEPATVTGETETNDPQRPAFPGFGG